MRSGKRVAKKKPGKRIDRRKSNYVLRRLLGLVLIAIVGATLYGKAISEARQRQNIQQCQILLGNIFSFEVRVEDWAEKRAVEQMVAEFNKQNGYKGTQYQYKMYEMIDGYYWITSDFVHDAEFAMKAEQYYGCLMDMSIGLRSEEEVYIFEFMTEEQRLDYEEIRIGSKMMVQGILDIHEERNTYGEVTFITVTVRPKSDFETGGQHIAALLL